MSRGRREEDYLTQRALRAQSKIEKECEMLKPKRNSASANMTSTDPDILGSLPAMKRAAKAARRLAEATGTPLYVMKKGRVVNLNPPRKRTAKTRMTLKEPDWTKYADKVHDWIQEAFARVYDSQEQMSVDQSKAGMAASYCLLAAHDYLEIAFFAFHKKLYHPGMACLRPVAEMAITFLWCTFSVNDYVDRLCRWAKEFFDKSKKTYERLDRWVLDAKDRKTFATRKAEWEKSHYSASLSIAGNLPPLLNMLADIDTRRGGGADFQALYPMLYSPLCGSSHGVLVLDRYFTPSGSAIDRRQHAPMPPDAPWASLTAIVYLIVGIYKFFGWEYSQFLDEYRQMLGSCDSPQVQSRKNGKRLSGKSRRSRIPGDST